MDARTSASEAVPKKSANSSAALACIWVLTIASTFGWRLHSGLAGSALKKEYCIPVAGSPYKRSPIRSNWPWIISPVPINSVSNSKIRMKKVEIHSVHIYFSRSSPDLRCPWFCMLFPIFITVLFSAIHRRTCRFSRLELVLSLCL